MLTTTSHPTQASTARHELPSPCIISPQKEPSPCNKNNTGISADSAAPGDQAISAEDGKAIMDSYVERTPSTAPYFSHFLSDRPAGRSPEPQRPCPDSKVRNQGMVSGLPAVDMQAIAGCCDWTTAPSASGFVTQPMHAAATL